MRALRDFNTPKIITDDVTIFMGLIGDLFPALDVPRKRDLDFEATVKKSVLVIVTCLSNHYTRYIIIIMSCFIVGSWPST